MERQNSSSNNNNGSSAAPQAEEAKSKPLPNLAESLASSLNDELISDVPRPKLTHALDRFKRNRNASPNNRSSANGNTGESSKYRNQRRGSYDSSTVATSNNRTQVK